MIETVIAISLVLLSIMLPVKWAFSLSLAASYSLFYYLFADIATIMFVILFIRIALKKDILQALNNRLFQNHVLIVVLSIFTLLWATRVEVGISIVLAQIKVLIIAIVSLQIINEKGDLKYVIFGAVIGAIYICICLEGWKLGLFGVSISEYQANIDKYGRLLIQHFFPDRRTPINSNTWASLAALSSILGAFYYFYLVKNPKKIIKVIIFALIFLVFIIISDFGSRAAILSIFGGVILLYKAIPPRRFYSYVTVVFFLFYTGSITIDFIGQLLPEGSEILKNRLDESVEYEDPRIQIWLTGLNMAISNFVTGVGIGHGGIMFKDYMVYDFQNTRLALHNSFITHFAELGIFGLILFIRCLYLWQKPFIFRKSTQVLMVVVSMNILLNAFAHSFELENYFIAIIYSVHAYFLLEMKEVKFIHNKTLKHNKII